MNELEKIKNRIEEEREKLNAIVLSRDPDKIYRQSVLVDDLIAKYIAMLD